MTGGRGRWTRTRVALGDLAAQPGRTVLAVLALAPVVAAWFLLASVSGALAQRPHSDGTATLVITGEDLFDPSLAALTDDDVAAVAAAGGREVTSVTPVVVRVVEVDDRPVQLRGADPSTWAPVQGLTLQAGRLPVEGADELVVTESLQRATRWRLGDTVRVFGTDFTVTGVVRATGTKVAALWMTLRRAEALFERPGEYQALVVLVASGVDADALRRRLGDAFPRLLVVDESRLQLEASTGQRSLGELARLFTTLGFIGIAAGTANATALMLAERVRSVGLLRVMGFSRSFVRGVLMMRAVLVTAGSVALGLAAAVPVVLSRPPVLIQSYTSEIRIRPWDTAAGVAASLAAAAVGALLAARRELRRPVGELLGA